MADCFFFVLPSVILPSWFFDFRVFSMLLLVVVVSRHCIRLYRYSVSHRYGCTRCQQPLWNSRFVAPCVGVPGTRVRVVPVPVLVPIPGWYSEYRCTSTGTGTVPQYRTETGTGTGRTRTPSTRWYRLVAGRNGILRTIRTARPVQSLRRLHEPCRPFQEWTARNVRSLRRHYIND